MPYYISLRDMGNSLGVHLDSPWNPVWIPGWGVGESPFASLPAGSGPLWKAPSAYVVNLCEIPAASPRGATQGKNREEFLK